MSNKTYCLLLGEYTSPDFFFLCLGFDPVPWQERGKERRKEGRREGRKEGRKEGRREQRKEAGWKERSQSVNGESYRLIITITRSSSYLSVTVTRTSITLESYCMGIFQCYDYCCLYCYYGCYSYILFEVLLAIVGATRLQKEGRKQGSNERRKAGLSVMTFHDILSIVQCFHHFAGLFLHAHFLSNFPFCVMILHDLSLFS